MCGTAHSAVSSRARGTLPRVFQIAAERSRLLVPIEVTLAIQLPDLSDRPHAGQVADRLAQLGGKVIGWTPENRDTPARATFKFETEAQCVLFLKVALDIPGVAVAT